jgi:hypothetical protein
VDALQELSEAPTIDEIVVVARKKLLPDTVRPVVDARPRTVWPVTVSAVAEAVERVLCPVAESVPGVEVCGRETCCGSVDKVSYCGVEGGCRKSR